MTLCTYCKENGPRSAVSSPRSWPLGPRFQDKTTHTEAKNPRFTPEIPRYIIELIFVEESCRVNSGTALYILKNLAREGRLTTRSTTFIVEDGATTVWHGDVVQAIKSLASKAGFRHRDVQVFSRGRLVVHVKERLFVRLYDLIFVSQKLPIIREGVRSRMTDSPSPLPAIFIGREKTQVRQIALVDRPPWPFHFLMELGGMIVVRTSDYESVFKELRQYLNNHPQFEVRVDAKECPDGTVTIYTYWFKEMKVAYKRGNMNVPH